MLARQGLLRPIPHFIQAISSIGFWGIPGNPLGSSTAFIAAKRVYYCPVRVPVPMVVGSLQVQNGATVSGNLDLGLYSLDGRLLCNTGSTAQAGTSATQTIAVTPANTTIGAGTYYLAVTLDNTTATLVVNTAAAVILQAMGVKAETTGSFGLPATSTFGTIADAFLPLVSLIPSAVSQNVATRFSPLPTITTLSAEAFGNDLPAVNLAAPSAAYPGANRILFAPFHLSEPIPSFKLFVANGATASGNVDVGVYSGEYGGNIRLIINTGSTAQSGTNTCQEITPTATPLGAGDYYLAVSLDNTTGTLRRTNPAVGVSYQLGERQLAPGSFGLPATAALAASITSAYIPLIGLHLSESVL